LTGRVAIIFTLALLLSQSLVGAPATAQEPTQAPSSDALRLLPNADAFGPGWTMPKPPVASIPSNAFRDGAVATYGGADGRRILLTVLILSRDTVAIRRGWEEAGDRFDDFGERLQHERNREDELLSVPPPPGCVEAKRIDGTDEDDGFDAGVNLCAADPDIVLLAVVWGDFGAQRGYLASDLVVSTALGAGGMGTPPAG
jgi:hypothetical protein